MPVPRINVKNTAAIATSGLAAWFVSSGATGLLARVYKLEGDDFTVSEGSDSVTVPMETGEFVDLYVTNDQVLAGGIRIVALEGE